ncbi:MAG: DNA alkylation repair protein [Clostridia bacterium]|nr:DNA alkylation repair protein [Clostridia bacterium]
MRSIKDELFSKKDEKYKKFTSALLPTVPCDKVIGVRTPILRKFAKELINSGDYENFLRDLPHEYLEENSLHGYILEGISDFNKCVGEIEKFLPYIDNWATCDTISPQVFKKHKTKLLEHINEWIKSDRTYTVRFGVCMLMKHFLDTDFEKTVLQKVAEIKSEEYYVNMVIAWFFATALTKQYDSTIIYLENKILSPWVHNKAIQKAIESYRIPKEKKEHLKSLKIK